MLKLVQLFQINEDVSFSIENAFAIALLASPRTMFGDTRRVMDVYTDKSLMVNDIIAGEYDQTYKRSCSVRIDSKKENIVFYFSSYTQYTVGIREYVEAFFKHAFNLPDFHTAIFTHNYFSPLISINPGMHKMLDNYERVFYVHVEPNLISVVIECDGEKYNAFGKGITYSRANRVYKIVDI